MMLAHALLSTRFMLRLKLVFVRCSIVFSLAFAVSSARASTYYVREGASGDCSSATTDSAATALGDIDQGLTCLHAGDELTIHQGTYSVGITDVTDGWTQIRCGTDDAHRIVIQGAPGEKPLLQVRAGKFYGFDLYSTTTDAESLGCGGAYTTWKDFVIDGETAQIVCDTGVGTHGATLFRFEAG